ncbi:MAG: hypothetical protein AAB320_04265 [Elusimicrobiota bacterium]
MHRLALSLLVLLPLFSGCVAEIVEKKKPRKGPIPEVGYIDTGGGEVKYSIEGWPLWVKARRRTALRRMRRVCGKLKAVITDEFTRQDVEVPYSGEDVKDNLAKGMKHYTVAPFEHIVFDCVLREPSAAPAPQEPPK